MLGIQYPILQGPFGGGLSTVALTVAVSNAGGLGGYGAYTHTAQEIHAIDRQLKAATNRPYNINLWVSDTDAPGGAVTDKQYEDAVQAYRPYFDELGIPAPPKPPAFQSRFEDQFQAILDIKPRVFSFMFGVLPEDMLEQCRKLDILTVAAATTLDEALALDATSVDMIIASGFEAGGHRPSFLEKAESSLTGTFVLVQLLREKTRKPLIAAGGIATGRGIRAAMTLGADAAQIGTAFLACEESGALPVHREYLFSEAARHTSLSRAFTGRLGRGITSRVAQEMINRETSILPFPLQSSFMSYIRKAALEQRKHDMVLFWGGQIAPILQHRKAHDLMTALVSEASA